MPFCPLRKMSRKMEKIPGNSLKMYGKIKSVFAGHSVKSVSNVVIALKLLKSLILWCCVSFCGACMSKKEWVIKTVVLILNCFPLMVHWDVWTKWWHLLLAGTVSPNSYQSFRFSLTATISSLLIVRKVIPFMDDLQYTSTARNIKIWSLTGLCKQAWSILRLIVLLILSQGDIQWHVAKNGHVVSMLKSDLRCKGSERP